jgi:predicted RNA methylase
MESTKEALIESIKKMIPVGNRLELPKNDIFPNYAQVKKALITAGGKYKKCGFEFTENAEVIQSRLVGGEAINDKKKYQFFATPSELAERLVALAEITPYCRVGELQAGQGAIANLVKPIARECVVVELMPENCKALLRQGWNVIEGDLLSMSIKDLGGGFDRIIANPPFTKNQDVDHIKHMFSMLNAKGKLVSMASKSWIHGSQKKQVAFRDWLDDVDATITEVPAGAFKESGTSIGTVIVEINK